MESRSSTAGWTTAGSVNFILDNMIAEKKVLPMIVVMPFGHATPFGGGRGGGAGGGNAGGAAPLSNTLLARNTPRSITGTMR